MTDKQLIKREILLNGRKKKTIYTKLVNCFECRELAMLLNSIATHNDRLDFSYRCQNCGKEITTAHKSLSMTIMDFVCVSCEYKTTCIMDIDPPVDDTALPCVIESTGLCPSCSSKLEYHNHSESEILLICTSCTENIIGLPLTETLKKRHLS